MILHDCSSKPSPVNWEYESIPGPIVNEDYTIPLSSAGANNLTIASKNDPAIVDNPAYSTSGGPALRDNPAYIPIKNNPVTT